MQELSRMLRSPAFRDGFRLGLALPIYAAMAAAGVWRHAWRSMDHDQLEADVRKLWGQRGSTRRYRRR